MFYILDEAHNPKLFNQKQFDAALLVVVFSLALNSKRLVSVVGEVRFAKPAKIIYLLQDLVDGVSFAQFSFMQAER